MERKRDVLRRVITQLREKTGHLIQGANTEWYSLFKDEIRNSIAIEGVFANRRELVDVLEHNKRTDKQKAASILGYFESASAMYEYAVNQYKENEFSLRMADIKQIHTLLMRYEKELGSYIGELGEFRNTQAEVVQASFSTISELYIRPAMELLVRWVNHQLKKQTYDPLVVAAMAHVWFELIHPFRDGNGRAGRILLSYILIGYGLLNIAITGISSKDRDHYYDALEKADDQFEAINRKIEEGARYTVEEVDRCLDEAACDQLLSIVTERLEDALSRVKDGAVVREIDKEAKLPLRDLAAMYDYSQNYLRNLINRGKLKGVKKGKTWYVRVRDMAAYVERVESE